MNAVRLYNAARPWEKVWIKSNVKCYSAFELDKIKGQWLTTHWCQSLNRGQRVEGCPLEENHQQKKPIRHSRMTRSVWCDSARHLPCCEELSWQKLCYRDELLNSLCHRPLQQPYLAKSTKYSIVCFRKEQCCWKPALCLRWEGGQRDTRRGRKANLFSRTGCHPRGLPVKKPPCGDAAELRGLCS